MHYILISYLISTQKLGLYKIGEFALFASMIGSYTEIVILIVFFKNLKPINHIQYKIPWGYYFRTVFTLEIVASLNHMVLLIIQFADVFTHVSDLIILVLSIIYSIYIKYIC